MNQIVNDTERERELAEARDDLERVIHRYEIVDPPMLVVQRHRRRRRRLAISFGVIFYLVIGLGFLLWALWQGFDYNRYIFRNIGPELALSAYGTFCVLVLSGLLANHFLAGDFRANWEVERAVADTYRRLQLIRGGIAESVSASVSVGLPGASATMRVDRGPRQSPREEVGPIDPTEASREMAQALQQSMRTRLGVAVERLQGSARLNLIFGLMSAIAGVGFLMWLALESRASIAAAIAGEQVFFAPAHWFNWTVRISVSVMTQVLAFFFLSTYRRNLTEIKFFENELTTVETRFSALFLALSRADKDEATVGKVLLSLAGTERNFVLRRGESTANIRQLEQDLAQFETMIDVVSKVYGPSRRQAIGRSKFNDGDE